jgi:hypothetical protein
MKREELEIEERIAQALGVERGVASRGTQSRVEAALGLSGGQPTEGTIAGAVLGELVSRLEWLAKPTVPAGGSNWQGVVSSLNPILGGVLRLFGGGGEDAPTVLPLAVRPTTERYDMGFGREDRGYFFVDRDAAGQVRAVRPTAAPAVVVQIEAMDSQSFLERTPEIAEAFKRVLLESEGMQSLLSTLQE